MHQQVEMQIQTMVMSGQLHGKSAIRKARKQLLAAQAKQAKRDRGRRVRSRRARRKRRRKCIRHRLVIQSQIRTDFCAILRHIAATTTCEMRVRVDSQQCDFTNFSLGAGLRGGNEDRVMSANGDAISASLDANYTLTSYDLVAQLTIPASKGTPRNDLTSPRGLSEGSKSDTTGPLL